MRERITGRLLLEGGLGQDGGRPSPPLRTRPIWVGDPWGEKGRDRQSFCGNAQREGKGSIVGPGKSEPKGGSLSSPAPGEKREMEKKSSLFARGGVEGGGGSGERGGCFDFSSRRGGGGSFLFEKKRLRKRGHDRAGSPGRRRRRGSQDALPHQKKEENEQKA